MHEHQHGERGHSHDAALERSKPDRRGHDPTHTHDPADFGFAFAVGTALNIAFVLIEATYGFLANSMALLADAGHNLSDVVGLIAAWSASVLTRRVPTPRFTYGLRSSSILAALANAILLMIAVGAIAWEAIQRLGSPEAVAGKTVMIVAAIGIFINGFTAWLFFRGRESDINIRGAFLHMAADAAVSFGVVLAGGAMLLTGWLWLDPVASLLIAAVIVWGTWGLLRDSVTLALHAVPPGIDPVRVRQHLEGLAGVVSIHDLHIWPMSTTETALTCHFVMPGGHPGDAFVGSVTKRLQEEFGIGHVTVQVEVSDAGACALAPDEVV